MVDAFWSSICFVLIPLVISHVGRELASHSINERKQLGYKFRLDSMSMGISMLRLGY